MRPDPFKAVGVILAGLYFFPSLIDPGHWRLLDWLNLLVHEAGHPIFGIFGEFPGCAGGTIAQILMPILFINYFYRQGQRFSSAIAGCWLGESILNVSHYAADAQALELPLFGAGDRIHDWNWMLDTLNILPATPFIAGLIRLVGTLVLLAGLWFGLKQAWEA
jgi:hypothetical protein